ncbi:MAG: hypothetical protein ACYDB9_11905 [Gammaproteobacteria bacterium]
MSAGQFGYLVGAFAMALLFAVVWLIICKVIPPLRRKLGVSYGIAMALAFVPSLITVGGPNIFNLIGSLLCVGLLFWQYKRAQKKLLASASQSDNVTSQP